MRFSKPGNLPFIGFLERIDLFTEAERECDFVRSRKKAALPEGIDLEAMGCSVWPYKSSAIDCE